MREVAGRRCSASDVLVLVTPAGDVPVVEGAVDIVIVPFRRSAFRYMVDDAA